MRDTRLEVGLAVESIQNWLVARYRLNTKSPSKLNCPSSLLQKFYLLMIQIYTRYFPAGKFIKNQFTQFCSTSPRYTEPDTGLIQNLKVSSIVPYLSHKNLIYWWSKSILDIFSVNKSISFGTGCLSSLSQKSHLLMI